MDEPLSFYASSPFSSFASFASRSMRNITTSPTHSHIRLHSPMELVFFSSVSSLHRSLSRPFFPPLSSSAKLTSSLLPNPPSSRQIPPILSRRSPRAFTVLAGSVAVSTKAEQDNFPAEVRVTETKQPRSSVSFLYAFNLTVLPLFSAIFIIGI